MATTRLGWSIVEVGIAFSFFGAGSIVLGPWLAHMADRVGRRPIAVLAPIPLAGFAVGLVTELPQPAVFALAFVAGGALTAFSASWYALLADTAGERRLSRTFGIISAARPSASWSARSAPPSCGRGSTSRPACCSRRSCRWSACAAMLTFRPPPPALPSAT